MYMEAYGQVGSWADSVIKRSLEASITRKIAKEDAKEVLPKQEVPRGEGGSTQATPQANTEVGTQANDVDKLNSELQASNKARASLEKRVANWKAKATYRNDLYKMAMKDLWKYKGKEMVGGK